MDRAVWAEFGGQWPRLVDEVTRIREQTGTTQAEPEREVVWSGGTESRGEARRRLCQDFFRQAVLSAYDFQCCMCDVDLAPLLVAAHIVPWADDEVTRADPQNGLCLCALHHSAFDAGLVSVDASLRIVCSRLVEESVSTLVRSALLDVRGRALVAPLRFPPRREFILQHHAKVFRTT